MENKRRKKHTDIECVPLGHANGSALNRPLTNEEKSEMIDAAEFAYYRTARAYFR